MRDRKWFPMQDGPPVPWAFAEAIFAMYHELFRGQGLDGIANRGGFGYAEIPHFAAALKKQDEREKQAWEQMFQPAAPTPEKERGKP